MKNLVFALLMLFSWSSYAQETESVNTKLEFLRNEKNKSTLNKQLKKLEGGSAEDLELLIQYYTDHKEKKEQVTNKLLKKYPESNGARMARMQLFLPLEGAQQTEALVKKLMKDYPGVNLDMEKNLAAMWYAEELDTTKAMHYVNLMEDKYYQAFAVKSLMDIVGGFDSKIALELGTRALPKVGELKTAKEPSVILAVPPQEVYREFITAYAKLLFKAGKYDEAYAYTKEAYDRMEGREDRELIENYAFLSSLRGDYEESFPILAEAVKGGKQDAEYIEQIRKAYTKLYPGQDIDAFIASLKKDFINKIKADITPMLVKEAAPDFYVTDVNGKKVTLADFKGKTIVLDFWATWCGPCVASFPAMQLAVNRFVQDPNVKFLFIHTWENAADPLTDAKNFLQKRGYSFDLYMDTKDPVTKTPPAAAAFGIKGIPAKFVIDGDGNIRFNVEGFEGTAEEASEELVQMIEMARQAG